MRHKLIEKASGNEVKPGMNILDFRGEIWVFESFRVTAPPSTGKITVRKPGPDETFSREFYPSVCDLEIVEVKE
jgi:hypothetical protein